MLEEKGGVRSSHVAEEDFLVQYLNVRIING